MSWDPKSPKIPDRIDFHSHTKRGGSRYRVYLAAAVGVALIHAGWYLMQKTDIFAPPSPDSRDEIILPSFMPVTNKAAGGKDSAK